MIWLVFALSWNAPRVECASMLKPLSLGLHPLSFHDGVRHRDNAAIARTHFAAAAAEFDREWIDRDQSPQLALNRGRAHALAGDLPRAIRAFRDGLSLAPWDAELQAGLTHCRSQVNRPDDLRPESLTALRHRVSPTDLALASLAFSFCLAVGLALRFTAQPSWCVPLAVFGGVGVLLVIVIGLKLELDADFERSHPVLVVVADTTLRLGNGPSYDPRLPYPLPKGAEVRERMRRGGWVQIELPNGVIGWLPESSLL